MVVYEEPVRIQLPEYLLTLLLGVLLNKNMLAYSATPRFHFSGPY